MKTGQRRFSSHYVQFGRPLVKDLDDGTRQAQPRKLIWCLRFVGVLLAGSHFWTSRFAITSDGISYLEIARNYASGNWSAAVNSYWSPLYSWLVALSCRIAGLDRTHEIVILHVINLLAYLCALAIFDRLTIRLVDSTVWETEIAKSVYFLTAYAGFLWAAYFAISVARSTPDMIGLALVLLLSLLLLEMRRHSVSVVTFGLYGLVLAMAYLAKSAMLVLAPIYIWSAIWPKKPWRNALRKAAIVSLPFAFVSFTWISVMRIYRGYWTAGESAKLNYAWEVCGAARWIHWQGEPGDIGRPLHPTRKLLSSPAVYEFRTPIPATYPPWYDPSYWYAGVKPSLKLLALARVVWANARNVFFLLLFTPGLLLLVVIAGSTRDSRSQLFFLAVPAIATLALYTAVFVDVRYVAGSLLIIALVPIASLLPRVRSKFSLLSFGLATLLTCGFCIQKLTASLWVAAHDLVTGSNSVVNHSRLVADELRARGLKPGGEIGYIGLGIRAYWPTLAGAQIITEIPVGTTRNGGFQDVDDDSQIERFWRSTPEDRNRVLEIMKTTGARAVIADAVPTWADTTGWIKLKSFLVWRSGEERIEDGAYRDYVYARFLCN